MTQHYTPIDREDLGPHDVIGINSVATFWGRFSEDEQVKLNALMVARDEYLEGLVKP